MKVGDSIAGYEVVARLSSGGMASVYLGRRGGAGGFAKHVAIKVVHPHLAEDPNFVEMFLDEARLSARIEHPNVVHVHDLGQADGAYFMVMEYVAGTSLAQLLRVVGQKKLRLAPEVAVAIVMKLASGLHAAHELTNEAGENLGVVHRDVSPHNVLLAFKGHVKLIDFGIAKAAERSQHTQGALLKGKVRYMAPEQAFGLAVDRRSDLYALGIMLWEMLTSRRLFDGESDLQVLEAVRDPRVRPPGTLVSGIPPALDAIVMAALSKDPDLRPDTCEAFRAKLATALPGALAIDAPHVADLLGVLMKEVIETEQQKLGNMTQLSMVLGAPTLSANAQLLVERLALPMSARSMPPDGARPSDAAAAATARPAPPPRPTVRLGPGGGVPLPGGARPTLKMSQPPVPPPSAVAAQALPPPVIVAGSGPSDARPMPAAVQAFVGLTPGPAGGPGAVTAYAASSDLAPVPTTIDASPYAPPDPSQPSPPEPSLLVTVDAMPEVTPSRVQVRAPAAPPPPEEDVAPPPAYGLPGVPMAPSPNAHSPYLQPIGDAPSEGVVPVDAAPVEDAPAPRRRWVLVAVIAGLVVVGAAVAIGVGAAMWAGDDETAQPTPPPAVASPAAPSPAPTPTPSAAPVDVAPTPTDVPVAPVPTSAPAPTPAVNVAPARTPVAPPPTPRPAPAPRRPRAQHAPEVDGTPLADDVF